MKPTEPMMRTPANWSFENLEVAEHFDNHVREQLPFYDIVSGAVSHIARHYLPYNGLMYDIGASTGNITQLLAPTISARKVSAISVESSEAMARRFQGVGQLLVTDCLTVDYQEFDVAVLFLVLMFLPADKREDFLSDLINKKRKGGAIIIVDKVEPSSGYFGTIMRRLTMAGKIANGATAEQVLAKELSLEGLQRPVNSEFLNTIGKQFFQYGEFAGWVIEE